MKIALLVINEEGRKLAQKVKSSFQEASLIFLYEEKIKEQKPLKLLVEEIFHQYEGLVFFAAMGIVVRLIGPLAKSKFSDPAVVCVDTAGRFSISVLSGHEGGANQLAFDIAAIIDAQPVITTGTETCKNIILGIGCRRGISSEKVKKAIREVLKEENIDLQQVRLAATVDLKKDETGLLEGCSELGIPLLFIAKESLQNFPLKLSPSKIVEKHLGVTGVCEPCALIAGKRTQLRCQKKIIEGVTVALAEENFLL